MSEQSQGPGWWLASDGRWYPPETAASPPAPPGLPPGGYPQPGSTNGFTIASMVLGILWLYCIGSILALVFGYKARKEIDQSGGAQQGRGLATAGIVLGWIGLVGAGLLVVGFVAIVALSEDAQVSFNATGEAIEDAGDPFPDPLDDDLSESGGRYGSDPVLDRLYDECEAGEFASCDELYLESPVGSEYEAFGDTCGDRNEPNGYCVDLYGE